jgi:hypothetical protein
MSAHARRRFVDAPDGERCLASTDSISGRRLASCEDRARCGRRKTAGSDFCWQHHEMMLAVVHPPMDVSDLPVAHSAIGDGG